MNRQYIESQIEYEISKFSNIDFKLNEYTLQYSNRRYSTLILININVNGIREEYELDFETFEVLDQVE